MQGCVSFRFLLAVSLWRSILDNDNCSISVATPVCNMLVSRTVNGRVPRMIKSLDGTLVRVSGKQVACALQASGQRRKELAAPAPWSAWQVPLELKYSTTLPGTRLKFEQLLSLLSDLNIEVVRLPHAILARRCDGCSRRHLVFCLCTCKPLRWTFTR